MDLFNVLVFIVIPVLTVLIVFITTKKRLWIAPLISTVLAFITYATAHYIGGITLIKLFKNSEWSAFFVMAMLIHLGIVIVLTLIAYIISHSLKRKKQNQV